MSVCVPFCILQTERFCVIVQNICLSLTACWCVCYCACVNPCTPICVAHSWEIIICMRQNSLELHSKCVCMWMCVYESKCIPACIQGLVTLTEKHSATVYTPTPPPPSLSHTHAHTWAYLYFTAFIEIVSGVKILLYLEMENQESKQKWEKVQNRCFCLSLNLNTLLSVSCSQFFPFFPSHSFSLSAYEETLTSQYVESRALL